MPNAARWLRTRARDLRGGSIRVVSVASCLGRDHDFLLVIVSPRRMPDRTRAGTSSGAVVARPQRARGDLTDVLFALRLCRGDGVRGPRH